MYTHLGLQYLMYSARFIMHMQQKVAYARARMQAVQVPAEAQF